MQFDPSSRSLFTDDGEFLKKLYCPRGARWRELAVGAEQRRRHCQHCAKTVHATDGMDDAQIAELLAREPEVCLALNLDQDNVRVLPFSAKRGGG